MPPRLEVTSRGGISLLWDPGARARGRAVAFTSRGGGKSSGSYESLNLGDLVGDDPGLVGANRELVADAIGARPGTVSYLRQVHGCGVVEAESGDALPAREADAVIVRAQGVWGAVLTADCVPVVVEGVAGMAAIHAGWRGLVAGVIEAAVAEVGAPRSAWIGPSIEACCYEVGPEVIDAFRARALPVHGDDRLSPSAAVAVVLRRSGVPDIARAGICTSCDDGYFSYRRDGVTGRQGAFAGFLDGG
ncbi:MAG TPA: polyphenol oxidase family protein [Actinomycetota bacterium]|nr:polyphenol oxidase family protein [Actinomycetota bacterium]